MFFIGWLIFGINIAILILILNKVNLLYYSLIDR